MFGRILVCTGFMLVRWFGYGLMLLVKVFVAADCLPASMVVCRLIGGTLPVFGNFCSSWGSHGACIHSRTCSWFTSVLWCGLMVHVGLSRGARRFSKCWSFQLLDLVPFSWSLQQLSCNFSWAQLSYGLSVGYTKICGWVQRPHVVCGWVQRPTLGGFNCLKGFLLNWCILLVFVAVYFNNTDLIIVLAQDVRHVLLLSILV